MATATMPGPSDTIKLEVEPQVFALRFTTGKTVASRFPGGRVMFTTMHDGRKLFLNNEEASQFEHELLDQRIAAGDFIRVRRVAHGRGGGFAIRVERVEDALAPDDQAGDRKTIALLEKSIEMQRARNATRTAGTSSESNLPAPAATTSATNYQERNNGNNTVAPPNGPTITAPPATAKGTMTGLVAGALMASIDAYLLAADYARSKGIAVDLHLDFNAEDIRTSASGMLIEYWKSGGTR